MKATAKLLVLAGLIGLAGGPVQSPALAQKAATRGAEGAFAPHHNAAFPGETKQSTRESKTASGRPVTTHLRELKSGDRYYGTAWTPVPSLPPGLPDQARLLEVAAGEALKTGGPGATVVSRQDVIVNGVPGLAYVIDMPQGNTRLRQQIFLVSGVLVEQTYTGPAGTETRREANRFFDSLRLIP